MRLRAHLSLVGLLFASNIPLQSRGVRIKGAMPFIMQAGAPVFSATPASIDMGSVAVGVSTPVFTGPPPFAQPIQISNAGTGSLTANFSFSSPEFAFDSINESAKSGNHCCGIQR
jgi:hypothetical protein